MAEPQPRLLRHLGELKSLGGPEHHAGLDAAMDYVLQEAEEGLDVTANLKLAQEAARDAKEQTFNFRHYTAAG